MLESADEEPDELALIALDVLRAAEQPLGVERLATEARLTPLGTRVALRALRRCELADEDGGLWSSTVS
jgi:hypothetical protein